MLKHIVHIISRIMRTINGKFHIYLITEPKMGGEIGCELLKNGEIKPALVDKHHRLNPGFLDQHRTGYTPLSGTVVMSDSACVRTATRFGLDKAVYML